MKWINARMRELRDHLGLSARAMDGLCGGLDQKWWARAERDYRAPDCAALKKRPRETLQDNVRALVERLEPVESRQAVIDYLYVRSRPGGRTKTGRSRVVPLATELLGPLAAAKRDPSGFVLGAQRITVRAMLKRVARIGKRAGIPANLLLLRHTRASWWVQAGVSIAKVAKWLGHSVKICEMHYAGLRDGWDPDADRIPDRAAG